MREILFRAKRVDNGEWVEGLPQKMWGEWHIINTNDENTVYHINPETICQYTGLRDKNGNRIWGNDIVGFKDMTPTESGYWEQGCIGKVAWDEGECCFYATDRLFAESWEILQDCIVLGNAFDNPELMKE